MELVSGVGLVQCRYVGLVLVVGLVTGVGLVSDVGLVPDD